MERARISAFGLVVLLFGLYAESTSFAWSDTRHWLPDLAVGLALVACAGVAFPRDRRTGALLAATGLGWFLGNLAPALLYAHRGSLMHLQLTYPGARPRSRRALVGVVAAYAAALVFPVWPSEVTTIVASVVLLVLVAGRPRRAVVATVVVAGALVGGAVARLAVPSGELVDPTLLLYQAALVAAAVLLVTGLRSPAASTVTDLVVELGDSAPGALREALADVLGDPSLEVGYWVPFGGYLDDAGRPVGAAGPDRAATYVDRAGQPVAMIVHDASVLNDPLLAEAVAEATRLAATHAALQGEERAQLADLAESRRRLVTAGDAERSRMGDRLRSGPARRLRELDAELTAVTMERPSAEHLRRADDHVREVIVQLDDLAAGLQPAELTDGLGPALTALAERVPLAISVDGSVGRLDPEVERAAYFLCAEALTNVVKHARTDRASLTLRVREEWLIVHVVDSGSGGADLAGNGLVGLRDRVETLGGSLSVVSPPRGGTRLTAELPLGRQPWTDDQPILSQSVDP